MSLMQTLTPVYPEDLADWKEIATRMNWEVPPLFWYGGAALDSKPFVDLYTGNFPISVRRQLSRSVLPVLTDYSIEVVHALQRIYRDLDNRDLDNTGFSISSVADSLSSVVASRLAGLDIQEMIPLTLFKPRELARVREEYPDFHPSMTTSAVPDDEWHVVYISAAWNGVEGALLYALVENLTFWQEIVEQYSLTVEAFCALRAAGKSGSWDHTHSPQEGKLFSAIRTSTSPRPGIWIADDCEELRLIWREIEPHDRGNYGEMHYFETNWPDGPQLDTKR